MLKIIKGVLGTLFKMPDQEITDILKKSDGSEGVDEEKVLQLIIDKDKERIQKLKDSGPKWEDAMKKATKEVWSKVENLLKTKTEIESDLQGEELIDLVAKTVKEKPKADNSKKVEELSDDDIKKHPVYLAAEKAWKKSLTEKEKEKEEALTKLTKDFTQKETLTNVRTAAISQFKKAHPNVILPADPAKAEKAIKKLLLDELEPYEYQLDENGKYLLLHKEGEKKGKRVEDEHGHALDFDGLIKKIAESNFEFKASDEKKSPNNGGGGNGGDDGKKVEKKFTGKAPSNKAEYLGILTDASLTSEQKLEVKQDYGEQFSKN